MAKKVKAWYEPKVHTGWRKGQSTDYRRRLTRKAHGNNLLTAGRSLQALANVTTDPTTARLAKADANYFFKKHKERKNR